ncbi:oxygen-independent coproporphyrinogen III oxidase [Bradyrhizobium sp. DASA03120]|uniref:oxygen-independent coproporphyrinogen III oxidase n=1 Tax=Bradyrhizobium sp. SMVTL-02 TaxID=3395917 RepID=UPI003F6F71DA
MQPSILKKYCNAQVPWYTIYPTASQFSAEVGAKAYENWLSRLPPCEPVSLYFHIPFCRSICWYCGFPTGVTLHDAPIIDYLSVLREEIRLVTERVPKELPVNDVHFGGGTPTLIKPAEFLDLMGHLRLHFAFGRSATIAIEIDPRAFTAEMAEALAAAGVSRASLGVQSFDPIVQNAINRAQTEAQTEATVHSLREHGISRINFDLIYGLPRQTVQSCVRSARLAAAMRPDRLAVFGYAHIPSFKHNQRLIDEAELPDNGTRAEQAAAVADTLVAAGYRQVGLDHFALHEDDLVLAQKAGRLRRNSLGYSADTCKTLIGLGPSAIGRLGDGYVQNEVTAGSYSRQIRAGRLAALKGYCLTPEDRVRSAIIERLMCDLEADVPAISAAHGFDPIPLLHSAERLALLTEDGIVDMRDGLIRVRQEHRFLIRCVAAAFDVYPYRSPS